MKVEYEPDEANQVRQNFSVSTEVDNALARYIVRGDKSSVYRKLTEMFLEECEKRQGLKVTVAVLNGDYKLCPKLGQS